MYQQSNLRNGELIIGIHLNVHDHNVRLMQEQSWKDKLMVKLISIADTIRCRKR